jgi:hypothetical protein
MPVCIWVRINMGTATGTAMGTAMGTVTAATAAR